MKLPKSIVIVITSTIGFDLLFTLLGQSSLYWKDTSYVAEGSPIGFATLSVSPYAFIFFMLIYAGIAFILLNKLELKFALPLGVTVALVHIYGSSSWISYLVYKFMGHNQSFLSWYLLIAYLAGWGGLFSLVIYRSIVKAKTRSEA